MDGICGSRNRSSVLVGKWVAFPDVGEHLCVLPFSAASAIGRHIGPPDDKDSIILDGTVIYLSSACGKLFAPAVEVAHETENSASENGDDSQENH